MNRKIEVYIHSKNGMYMEELPMSAADTASIISIADNVTEIDVLPMAIHKSYGSGELNNDSTQEYVNDIYKLNELADKVSKLKEYEFDAFCAISQKLNKSDFDSLIRIAHSIENMTIYPCEDERALGEIILDRGLFTRLNTLHDDIKGLLDREQVGKLFIESNGGEIANRCYFNIKECELSAAKAELPPDRNSTQEQEDDEEMDEDEGMIMGGIC